MNLSEETYFSLNTSLQVSFLMIKYFLVLRNESRNAIRRSTCRISAATSSGIFVKESSRQKKLGEIIHLEEQLDHLQADARQHLMEIDSNNMELTHLREQTKQGRNLLRTSLTIYRRSKLDPTSNFFHSDKLNIQVFLEFGMENMKSKLFVGYQYIK